VISELVNLPPGIALQGRNHMRVRVQREADLGMTEHVYDHSGRNVIMDLEGVECKEPNTLSKSARAILGRD
jgi:hypothetical protein